MLDVLELKSTVDEDVCPFALVEQTKAAGLLTSCAKFIFPPV